MARKKLQYQAVSKSFFFVAAAVTPAALVFSSFSQPTQVKTSIAVESAGVLNTPIVPPVQRPVFTAFSPPQFLHQFPVAQQPQPAFEVNPPPIYDTGLSFFSQFIPVLRPPLPVVTSFANFAHITPPDFPPIQEKNDGIFVKKKRKPTKRELDPYKEEAEIKEKRREAIIDAVYGPVVEYTLPPLTFPLGPPVPPNLGDLPSIILQAQIAQKEQERRQAEAEDEEAVIHLLREIL